MQQGDLNPIGRLRKGPEPEDNTLYAFGTVREKRATFESAVTMLSRARNKSLASANYSLLPRAPRWWHLGMLIP
jgi:hypothetical protein